MSTPIPLGRPPVSLVIGTAAATPAVEPARAAPATGKRWMKGALVGLGLAGLGVVGWGVAHSGAWRRPDPLLAVPIRPVSRVDLQQVISASGRVDSSSKKVVVCELERLEIRSEGRMLSTGGSTAVLEVVDEGAMVKKGDVICRLDGSEYEELVRTQQIKTEQARAAYETARINMEVAQLAVKEYRDGKLKLNTESLHGQIALDESDLERAVDRARWTEMMLKKGYVPVAQRATAYRTVAEARYSLEESRTGLNMYEKYGHPRSLIAVESEVEMRRYEMTANLQRLTRTEERLKHYRKMVDLCAIKAPQDGIVIYAVDPNRSNAPRLEPGVMVRQNQQLFFLPDLSRMEVFTYLHESVAMQVREGMLARAKIEGLADRILEGHVVSIDPLPVQAPSFAAASEEVKFFVAKVKLDAIPKGLLPGMTAMVEVDVDRRLDVLAVPTESVAYEGGHEICYVAGADGLERRRVTIGRSSRELLEVTRGLNDGDKVVLNPAKVQAIDALVVNAEAVAEPENTASDTERFAPAASTSPTVE